MPDFGEDGPPYDSEEGGDSGIVEKMPNEVIVEDYDDDSSSTGAADFKEAKGSSGLAEERVR